MATNSPGEGKQLISAALPAHLLAEIDRRADQIKWSRNAYGVALLQRWFDNGAPPVDDLEELALEPLPASPVGPLARRTYVGAKRRSVAAATKQYPITEDTFPLAAEDAPSAPSRGKARAQSQQQR